MLLNLPASTELQETVAKDNGTPNTGPSFQRASLLFVASLGSFNGASLLLASI
jgi:hypothetical protein